MTALDLELQDKSLNRSIGYSLAFHVLVFLIFTVKAAIFAGDPMIYESAIKVDLVALPDKPELPPTSEAPPTPVSEATPAKAEPAAEAPKLAKKELKKDIDHEAINLDVAKRKQSAALEKLKQMSALDSIEREINQDNKRKSLEKLKPIKGNTLSSGSELTGVARLQHDNYIATVERRIRQNWSLPEWLARKNLKAQIRVRFDENGNVLSRDIFKSSGNPSFDEVVINTIERSSPVPAPPEKFVRILSVEGILLGFPE